MDPSGPWLGGRAEGSWAPASPRFNDRHLPVANDRSLHAAVNQTCQLPMIVLSMMRGCEPSGHGESVSLAFIASLTQYGTIK
jgi:hypothetical protein